MLMDSCFKKIIKSQKGSTTPIIVCISLIILAGSAFVADIGYVAIQHYLFSSAVRQTAMYGAEALLKGREAAEAVVHRQALNRADDLSYLNTVISDNDKEITVSMKKPLDYLFIKYFGMHRGEISAKTTVRLSGVMSFQGVRPFGVVSKKISFGTRVTLSNQPGSSKDFIKTSVLALDGENLENSIILGYPGKLTVGSLVETVPAPGTGEVKEGIGQLAGSCRHEPKCTFEKFNSGCSRIIIVPVTESVAGSSKLKILGFAAFFIEDVKTDEKVFYITGRFIKHTVKAELSDGVKDFGLSGIKIY